MNDICNANIAYNTTTIITTSFPAITTVAILLQSYPIHPVIQYHYSCRSSGQDREKLC